MTAIDHVRNFLDGLGGTLEIGTASQYIVPKRGGFSRDMRNLASDVRTVASGIRRNTNLYVG